MEDALRDYDAALVVEPRSASAHHNRGVVLEKLGRLEDAVAFDNGRRQRHAAGRRVSPRARTNARHRGDHTAAVADA